MFENMFQNMPLFIIYAISAGVLSSIAFGIVGSIVVIKRITYITGAISHIILGGIGLSLFINYYYEQNWLSPIFGSIIIALLSAVIIHYLTTNRSQRKDSIISILWAIGMSIGLILISKIPGYIDINTYLFGNILLVSLEEIYLLLIWDIFLVITIILFYYKIIAISFDEEFCKSKNIKIDLYNCGFLIITAITIVFLIKIVGIILSIALFVIPAATISCFVNKVWQIIFFSIMLCLVFVLIGFQISYQYDLPSGATIVMVSGITYLLSNLFVKIVKLTFKRT